MAMAEVKNSLPERINVMRVITYDVEKIIEYICQCDEKTPDQVTLDDCLSLIEDWVAEDFGSTRGLIYQDENGNDL